MTDQQQERERRERVLEQERRDKDFGEKSNKPSPRERVPDRVDTVKKEQGDAD